MRYAGWRDLYREAAQTGDGDGAAIFGGGFGLVVGERPVAGRRSGAEDSAIDDHGGSILVRLRRAWRPVGVGDFWSCLPVEHALDGSYVGVIRVVDGAKTLQVAVRERGAAIEFGGTGQTGERLRVLGVGEQNLLPGLLGEVHAAAVFECVGFVEQRLGYAIGKRTRRMGGA